MFSPLGFHLLKFGDLYSAFVKDEKKKSRLNGGYECALTLLVARFDSGAGSSEGDFGREAVDAKTMDRRS